MTDTGAGHRHFDSLQPGHKHCQTLRHPLFLISCAGLISRFRNSHATAQHLATSSAASRLIRTAVSK